MTVLNHDSKRRATGPAAVMNGGKIMANRILNQSRSDAFISNVGLSFGGVYAFRSDPVPIAAKGVQTLGVRGDLRMRAIMSLPLRRSFTQPTTGDIR